MYTSNTIPAGIMTSDIEIYYDTHKNDIYYLQDGNKQHWKQLPDKVKEKILDHLTPEIKKLIKKEFDVETIDEITTVFLRCRFGNLDYVPDFTICGNMVYDAPHCENLMTCKAFGKVCQIPAELTRMEYIILREISTGRFVKEIAYAMNLSETTVRTHIQRVHKKTNCNSNVELSAWAHKLKIV